MITVAAPRFWVLVEQYLKIRVFSWAFAVYVLVFSLAFGVVLFRSLFDLSGIEASSAIGLSSQIDPPVLEAGQAMLHFWGLSFFALGVSLGLFSFQDEVKENLLLVLYTCASPQTMLVARFAASVCLVIIQFLAVAFILTIATIGLSYALPFVSQPSQEAAIAAHPSLALIVLKFIQTILVFSAGFLVGAYICLVKADLTLNEKLASGLGLLAMGMFVCRLPVSLEIHTLVAMFPLLSLGTTFQSQDPALVASHWLSLIVTAVFTWLALIRLGNRINR